MTATEPQKYATRIGWAIATRRRRGTGWTREFLHMGPFLGTVYRTRREAYEACAPIARAGHFAEPVKVRVTIMVDEP